MGNYSLSFHRITMAQHLHIDKNAAGSTLRDFFRAYYPHLSYPLLQSWLRKGEIRLNGKKISDSTQLQEGDLLKLPPVHFMVDKDPRHTNLNPRLAAEKLAAITLAETDDYLVINKPGGLAVQGGTGISQSIDDWLLAQHKSGHGDYRLVHRLDRATSGLMLIARNRSAAKNISQQFQQHQIRKTYWAIVHQLAAHLPAGGVITDPLKPAARETMMVAHPSDSDALSAETRLYTKAGKDNLLWLELNPLSGRKHQLRVHLSHHGLPIVGDDKYGDSSIKDSLPTKVGRHLLLHAWRLELPNGAVYQAEPPNYFPVDYFTASNDKKN